MSELDPKNPLVLSLYAVVLLHHGDLEEAAEYAQRAKALSPIGTGMHMIEEGVMFLQDNYESSIRLLEEIYRDRIPEFDKVKSKYQINGYVAAMEELALQLEELSHLQSLYIALFYNRAGQTEKAVYWLQRGYEMHDPDMPYAFLPLELRNLKTDPRIIELAEKMNLPL